MDNVRLLTPEEAAEFLGVTRRRVLQLPIEQVRLGDRTIRFRLRDLYEFAGVDDPNPWYEDDDGGEAKANSTRGRVRHVRKATTG